MKTEKGLRLNFHLSTVVVLMFIAGAMLGYNVAWRNGRTAQINVDEDTQKTIRFEERGFPCAFQEHYEDLANRRGYFDSMGIVINAVFAIVVSVLLAAVWEAWLRRDRHGPGSTPTQS